jgi:AraC-like DNA-binding protein
MFNLKGYILLVAAVQSVFLFLGLFTKKTKNRASNVGLGVLISVVSLELFFSWSSTTGYNNLPDAVPFWRLISYLFIPPALWLFFESNLEPQFKMKPQHGLFFVPALLQCLFGFFFGLFFQSAHNQIFKNKIIAKSWFFLVEIVPVIATLMLILWVGKKLIPRLHLPLTNKYLTRLLAVYAFVSIFLALWIALVLFDIQTFKTIEILLVGCVFLLGYIAYFEPDFFEISQIKKEVLNKFLHYNDAVELERLKAIFEEKAIFKQPKLTVAEVANELNLPLKYVSYLIGTLGINFNDFVNGYRVNEAIKRIKDPAESHKSLLGIALDVGFGSKSSFNQVFKQHTGKAPSDFLR